MELDQALALALAQYGGAKKRVNRRIIAEVDSVPFFGGKDMLQWIGGMDRPNVTALSEAMGITRGGASKGVARLTHAGLVTSYQIPENRKAVYYRLTPHGAEALARLKEAQTAQGAFEMRYIERQSPAQKQAVLDFLTGFTAFLAAEGPGETQKEGDA